MKTSKEYKNEMLMRLRLWLQDWIKRKEYSQHEAALKLGTTAGTINQFLSGKRSLSDDMVKQFIEKSGEKLRLLTWEEYNPIKKGAERSIEEEKRLNAMSLEDLKNELENEENIKTKRNNISLLASTSNAGEPFPLVRVPLFDAGAGEPCEFRDDYRSYDFGEDENFVYVTEQEARLGAFGIKVNGDSMAPTVDLGDVVIVMPTRHIDNGKVVLACWPGSDGDPGKRLVKRFKDDGKGNVLLYSDNSAHEPIVLDEDEKRDVRLFRVVKLVKDL